MMPGSVAAKVVARVWSGAPGTVVSAAPGAGKTALIVEVLQQLVTRAGLKIAVACPTRQQAYSVTRRLWRVLPEGCLAAPVNGAEQFLPFEVYAATRMITARGGGSVTVKTVEAWRYVEEPFDVMVVDEGYQATFAALASAAAIAPQLLIVGDSGQIGPVVAPDVSVLESLGAYPHCRAPEVFAARPDFETYHLGVSYRLGPETCKVVSDLYDFDIVSGRPHRQLWVDGGLVPEITAWNAGLVSGVNDEAMLGWVADRAVLCATGRYWDEAGGWTDMGAEDVAVVVSRNTQSSLVKGLLETAGVGDVTVGTANRLQGGQWKAVVAVDPLCGVATPQERDLDSGLLCVMISRHTTHLSWVYSDLFTADDGVRRNLERF